MSSLTDESAHPTQGCCENFNLKNLTLNLRFKKIKQLLADLKFKARRPLDLDKCQWRNGLQGPCCTAQCSFSYNLQLLCSPASSIAVGTPPALSMVCALCTHNCTTHRDIPSCSLPTLRGSFTHTALAHVVDG